MGDEFIFEEFDLVAELQNVEDEAQLDSGAEEVSVNLELPTQHVETCAPLVSTRRANAPSSAPPLSLGCSVNASNMQMHSFKVVPTPVSGTERLIPGPAGRLPRLSEREKKDLLTMSKAEYQKKYPQMNKQCSDSLQNISFHRDISATYLGEKTRIGQFDKLRDIKGSAGKFNLYVQVNEIIPGDMDACANLVDESGQITGLIHSEVFETYKLKEGDVMFLEQVSCIKFKGHDVYALVVPEVVKECIHNAIDQVIVVPDDQTRMDQAEITFDDGDEELSLEDILDSHELVF